MLVSDFVTPAWFEPAGADRIDFKQHLSKQLELARVGYISVFDTFSGWTQITARAREDRASCPAVADQEEN